MTTGKRKKVKYSSHPSSDNGWRSMESVGNEIGLSKNRVSQRFTAAMEKIVRSVFLEIRNRAPTDEELDVISKDESFQLLVAEVMESTQSSVDRRDP
jgi:sucrose-6-phosphate hydrolase SacC (GH32 family)